MPQNKGDAAEAARAAPASAAEPFDWDRLLASLKAWDEAERAVFQAHIQMIDDVSAELGGDARKLRERGL